MRLRDILQQAEKIRIQKAGSLVEKTIAMEISGYCSNNINIRPSDLDNFRSKKGVINVAAHGDRFSHILDEAGVSPSEKEWILFFIDKNQCAWILSSRACFLYTAFCHIFKNLLDEKIVEKFVWFRKISFSREKSTFDLFLTQYARMMRGFRREEYIREYARLGFTHIEVNALAGLFPCEKGVSGEFYPDFYTYCPALDQFVSSRLNKGIYPEEYLQANLLRLKENAALALKYGLIPGLLCFEPRSVPEELLQRYPTLRGARVDHPFRSFKPRYSLALAHPVVQKHYAELMTNLMIEVPEMEFITIWTNDSGAGFEHTKSLYVGRNGGAYLIREWKDDREIARTASRNVLKFFRLLRDTALKVNPYFRVITRLESFYGEREFLWPGLEEGIDVEANSLLTEGWEANFPHPEYTDIKVIGSALHNGLEAEEQTSLDELHKQNSEGFFYHSFGSHTNHEPLLGIPFPWLTYDKLFSAYKLGVESLAHIGGIQPPGKVPFSVNHEVFRRFQVDAKMNIEKAVSDIAKDYAGEINAVPLVKIWRLIDKAVRASVPLSIYSHYGVVWQRLFVRPLVPDIDRIPEIDRAYYEHFMCTSIHNPNRVDLSQDVLFELITKDHAKKAYKRIDENVIGTLDSALKMLKNVIAGNEEEIDGKTRRVFCDLYDRCRALKAFYETLRNTAAWIYALHEFLGTSEPDVRKFCREILDDLIEREIHNTLELLDLWESSPVEWMIVSESGETPFIYGDNFGTLLKKRITLMRKHKNDNPWIDPDYMFRVSNDPYAD
ncbi:MAG: hypothetical protein KAX11_00645 [Candidatus Aminicenantes bacterium]|nr:hypothetical protein [Candidatus Aminicenantes bacterium]